MGILECKDLSFCYMEDKPILSHLDLKLTDESGCVVMLGKNGAGKTTLLNILSGAITADEGELIRENMKLMYLPYEQPFYKNLTVLDHLKYFYRIFHNQEFHIENQEIQEILTMLDIHYLKQKLIKCSSGEKKKVGLACALLSNADIYLLDEPFIGLDVESTNELLRYIDKKKDKACFFLTTHTVLNLEKVCDQVYLLENHKFSRHTTNKEEIEDILFHWGAL